MSIGSLLVYTVECDVCREEESSGLTYPDGARKALAEKGWVFVDGKDYCPKCAPPPLTEFWLVYDTSTQWYMDALGGWGWLRDARIFTEPPVLALPTSKAIKFIEAPF